MGTVFSLRCNRCGILFFALHYRSKINLWFAAENSGWARSDSSEKWLCPDCQKEEKEREPKKTCRDCEYYQEELSKKYSIHKKDRFFCKLNKMNFTYFKAHDCFKPKPKCPTCKWGEALDCIKPGINPDKAHDWECWEARTCEDCGDENCDGPGRDIYAICNDWELIYQEPEPEPEKTCKNCSMSRCSAVNLDAVVRGIECTDWQLAKPETEKTCGTEKGPKSADVVVRPSKRKSQYLSIFNNPGTGEDYDFYFFPSGYTVKKLVKPNFAGPVTLEIPKEQEPELSEVEKQLWQYKAWIRRA